MTDDVLENLYFKDLIQHEVLTSQEEMALITILRDDSKKNIHNAALRKLVYGNLRFVVSVARRYQGRGLSLLDLINEGNLGLFKAAMRFDYSKNIRFISYAVWWIRQTIQKAIFERIGSMRLPSNKVIMVSHFKKALSNNFGDYEKTFAMKEFKDCETDIIDTMEKMMEISTDAPLGESHDNVGTLLDVFENPAENQDNILKEKDLLKVLNDAIAKLPYKESEIIQMFYGIDAKDDSSLRGIGKELHLSREKVRQLKNKAIRRINRNKEFQEKVKEFLN